jgi:hypothetical protein
MQDLFKDLVQILNNKAQEWNKSTKHTIHKSEHILFFLFSAEIETPEEREERRRRFIKFLHTPFGIPHQS